MTGPSSMDGEGGGVATVGAMMVLFKVLCQESEDEAALRSQELMDDGHLIGCHRIYVRRPSSRPKTTDRHGV